MKLDFNHRATLMAIALVFAAAIGYGFANGDTGTAVMVGAGLFAVSVAVALMSGPGTFGVDRKSVV